MNEFVTETTNCVICGSSDGQVEASGYDYVYRGSTQIATAWRCSGCGHVYLNPRPTSAGIAVLYPNNYASFSGKFTRGNSVLTVMKEFIMMRRITRLLNELPKNAKFLDVGCGDGQLLEAVKNRFPDMEVHGLDWRFEPDARYRLMNNGIILHESMLERAELPEASFDLITMNQLIEHLWEPRDCLLMVRRILSPSGRLYLTTPDVDGYDRKLFKQGLWGGYYFPRHINLFSKPLLHQLLADCGLEIDEFKNLVAPVVWCYSLKAWLQIRFPAYKRLYNAIDVHNLLLMAFFTMVDFGAIILGLTTSNQALVAHPVKATTVSF